MTSDEAFREYAEKYGEEAWLKRHAFVAGWLAAMEQIEEDDKVLKELIEQIKRTDRA